MFDPCRNYSNGSAAAAAIGAQRDPKHRRAHFQCDSANRIAQGGRTLLARENHEVADFLRISWNHKTAASPSFLAISLIVRECLMPFRSSAS